MKQHSPLFSPSLGPDVKTYYQCWICGSTFCGTFAEAQKEHISIELQRWLDCVQDAIWAKLQGGYFDLENMSDEFMQKISRLFHKKLDHEKAADIILRYATFTNYLHTKQA